MSEKDAGVNKFYISWLYLGLPFFQLRVLLGIYFFIGFLIPFRYIWTVVFNKLDHSLLFVFVLEYYHCLYWNCLIYHMKIQWHYLLQLTSHELNVTKSSWITRFESILDEDVPYSIVVENITVEETRDIFKALAMLLCVFLYIQFGVSEKAWSNIFTNSETVTSNFR